MDLAAKTFPINYDSFHAFLIANVPNSDGICSTDTGYTVVEKVAFTDSDRTAVQGYYDGLTQAGELAKSTPTMQQIISNKILLRIGFGQQLMADYGAQNILAGFTTSQVAQIADELSDVQALLQSGSLETTIALMNSLTPSSLITQDTINAFVARIQTYLTAGG